MGSSFPPIRSTRYLGQLTAKPFAVRCPANACSCKHGRRLPGLSRKKAEVFLPFSENSCFLIFLLFESRIYPFQPVLFSADRFICHFPILLLRLHERSLFHRHLRLRQMELIWLLRRAFSDQGDMRDEFLLVNRNAFRRQGGS